MPTTPELVLDLGQLRPQAFLDRDALDPEPSATGSRTDVREPEEIERLRFAQPSTYVDEGVAEADIDWVQSACVLCSNGCGMDIGVQDGRIVGVRGRASDRVYSGRLGHKGLFGCQEKDSPDR